MASIPSVHKLMEAHEARGLRVMAVTEIDPEEYDEEKQAVVDATKKHQLDYPCLLDDDAGWMRSASIEAVPTFLVVGRDGKVVYRYRGGVKPDSEAYGELSKAVSAAIEAGT